MNWWISNQCLYKRSWSHIDKIKIDTSWVTPTYFGQYQGQSIGARYRNVLSCAFHSLKSFRNWSQSSLYQINAIRYCLWKVKVLVSPSCPTLWDPMNHNPPGSSIHGILQARILEWVTIPFSRGSLAQGLNLGLLHFR